MTDFNLNTPISESTDSRLSTLKTWLKTLPSTFKLDVTSIEPASSDASFRRYFRVQTPQNAAYSSLYRGLVYQDASSKRD